MSRKLWFSISPEDPFENGLLTKNVIETILKYTAFIFPSFPPIDCVNRLFF